MEQAFHELCFWSLWLSYFFLVSSGNSKDSGKQFGDMRITFFQVTSSQMPAADVLSLLWPVQALKDVQRWKGLIANLATISHRETS